jgi:APA family basic amino acid/polyamine antiporter
MATAGGNSQVKGLGLLESATDIGRRSQSPGALLALSGGYNHLPDYVIFAVLLFYILTIVGLFVLRRTRPDLDSPYRAFGYPVLPAVYMAAAGLIEVLLLLYKPSYTWPGLIVVLAGLPVYFNWRGKATI